MLFAFDKSVKEMTIEDFKKITSEKEISEKRIILEYMRKYEPCAFTSEPVYDKLTGGKVFGANNGHTDGKYFWFESVIYHFDKYNIKLNDDFIEHVLKQQNLKEV